MTSKEWLDSLKPDVRDQFLKIADEVTDEANQNVKAKEAANRENIIKAGGKINTLTDAQRKKWVDAMKPVWKKFESEIGTDVIAAANGS
jgi:C4-dicarboxylate-binding protein DctP